MLRRWKYRFLCWFFDRPDALARRVRVENALMAHAIAGTRPTPAECRELAVLLGVPRWMSGNAKLCVKRNNGERTMIPTKQTILHDPANGLHGNCLSAVLASLLHLPIDEVPLFITPDTWVKDLNSWLRPFGLAYCMVEDFDCHIDAYGIEGLWHEVSGNTSRSKDVTHACVAKDGEFVFDPHPDDTGLTKITCHGFFIALEPWRVLTHNA